MIASAWTAGRDCLRQLVGTRRAAGLATLALFPAAALLAARLLEPEEVLDIDRIRWRHFLWVNGASLLLQAAGVWLAFAMGPLVASEDPSEGGLLFQLARPLAKGWIFAARLAACATLTTVWLATGQVALYAVAYAATPLALAGGPLRGLAYFLVAQVSSGFTYTALGTLLALVTARPFVWGVAYFFFSEMVLAGTHGILSEWTLLFHLRSLAARGLPDLHEILQKEMLLPLVTHARASGTLAALGVLLGTGLSAAVLGAWQFSRRDWTPPREER